MKNLQRKDIAAVTVTVAASTVTPRSCMAASTASLLGPAPTLPTVPPAIVRQKRPPGARSQQRRRPAAPPHRHLLLFLFLFLFFFLFLILFLREHARKMFLPLRADNYRTKSKPNHINIHITVSYSIHRFPSPPWIADASFPGWYGFGRYDLRDMIYLVRLVGMI